MRRSRSHQLRDGSVDHECRRQGTGFDSLYSGDRHDQSVGCDAGRPIRLPVLNAALLQAYYCDRQMAVQFVLSRLPGLRPVWRLPGLSSSAACRGSSCPIQGVTPRVDQSGCQGSMTLTPNPAKSVTLRVTTAAPFARAIAAIIKSMVAAGRPARWRAAKSSA